jgi:hypothetical protein
MRARHHSASYGTFGKRLPAYATPYDSAPALSRSLVAAPSSRVCCATYTAHCQGRASNLRVDHPERTQPYHFDHNLQAVSALRFRYAMLDEEPAQPHPSRRAATRVRLMICKHYLVRRSGLYRLLQTLATERQRCG